MLNRSKGPINENVAGIPRILEICTYIAIANSEFFRSNTAPMIIMRTYFSHLDFTQQFDLHEMRIIIRMT